MSEPFLYSREAHPADTAVRVGPVTIGGGGDPVVIAGPCTVESREQLLAAARAAKEAGAAMLRGGAFKQRTSPRDFAGLGEEGLRLLAEARAETGLPVVSEMTDLRQAALFTRYTDMVQVGERNMQNVALLRAAARTGLPVLLKRGRAATYEEWLLAAEYILREGNQDVVLCERGIRTFETYTRATFDAAAFPVLKSLTHLPVLADPSHAAGRSDLVSPLALAAVAAGAAGVMVEIHPEAARALCDGAQALPPAALPGLIDRIRKVSLCVK
ncbi:MAG TPA: 3-deoxy-7-phosphoheptulonate synthase [Oscillospiraceae bacterium]|nr:3-deoxy-7-phosphoheptulonate synthase [Oscillospiraceae bacterium]